MNDRRHQLEYQKRRWASQRAQQLNEREAVLAPGEVSNGVGAIGDTSARLASDTLARKPHRGETAQQGSTPQMGTGGGLRRGGEQQWSQPVHGRNLSFTLAGPVHIDWDPIQSRLAYNILVSIPQKTLDDRPGAGEKLFDWFFVDDMKNSKHDDPMKFAYARVEQKMGTSQDPIDIEVAGSATAVPTSPDTNLSPDNMTTFGQMNGF